VIRRLRVEQKIRHAHKEIRTKGKEKEENIKEITEAVARNPDGFVLKSPREGGGTHFFGLEMVKKMKESTLEELQRFVLMQKIKMSPEIGYLCKKEKTRSCSLYK